MKIVCGETTIRVYCYYCDACEERFYIEDILETQDVYCPVCGDHGDVAISSGHLKELMEKQSR